MKYDSFIFDLDGTLWDSTAQVAESWNMSLRRMGYTGAALSAEDIAGIMGMTEAQIVEKIFRFRFGAEAERVCGICLAEEVGYIAAHGGRIYEGVREMLAALTPGKPYIVSNCQAGYIEAFLSFSGLTEVFADFECIGNSGLSKAENIRLVIERNALKRPVYVGDTESDEKSAAAAECPFIHAAYGFGRAKAPLHSISCPTELLDFI